MTSPLRVLLGLIEQECMDITAVSLTSVTDAYLRSLSELSSVPPAILADFLVVATRLLVLKARALTTVEDDDDTKEPLLEQLRRYRHICNAADAMKNIARINGASYAHTKRWSALAAFHIPPGLSADALVDAMRQTIDDIAALDPIPTDSIQDVVSLKECICVLKDHLRRQGSFALHTTYSRSDIIHRLVTFLALLEMVRQQEVTAIQQERGGAIQVESV